MLPVLFGVGLACCMLKSDRQACPALTAEQNDALDKTLVMSADELVQAGRAEGKTVAMIVTDLHSAASFVGSRGCENDARRLLLKAQAVAALPASAPTTGAFVALPTGYAPLSPLSQPSNVGPAFAGSPPNGAPPATSAPQSPPCPPRPVIARMRCGQERCSVRPQPRAWDDAWGKFGFSIPAGWPVGVLAFEPAGWAEVSIDHPDHGVVTGFVELAKLVADVPAPAPPPPAPQGPAPQQASTGNCPGGVCPIPGTVKPAAKPMVGGGSFMPSRPTAAQRTRTRMQKLKTKRARAR